MGGYVPYPMATFAGLNLRDSADSVGDDCLDCLNVDLDRAGTKVRSRYGYDNLTASALSSPPSFLWRQNSTALLVSDGGTFKSLDSSGTATSLASQDVRQAVNFGTPAATYTYYGILAASTIRRLSGTTVSTPTATVDGVGGLAMPKTGYLAVQDAGNRLVVAPSDSAGGPNGAASSSSYVWFSEPGNAEAWKVNNYVQLTPGDGESILGIVSWRGNVFVFKETKLFVFYGNSTDASGNPVFNYRPVQLPSRIATASTKGFNSQIICAGEDGVYFVANDGVYVTTGDVPTLLSEDLYPLGTDDPLPSTYTATSGVRFSNAIALHFHKRRLFCALESGGSGGTLVYDIDSANWFVWDIHPTSFATWGAEDSTGLLYFGGGTSANHVYRFKSSFTTDDGAAISSYYQRGFSDYGREEEKTIAETQLWGTGTVNFKRARDFGSLDAGENITLGASPVIANSRSTIDKTGTLFSERFASVTGGAWAVHRCTSYLREDESPGSKRS